MTFDLKALTARNATAEDETFFQGLYAETHGRALQNLNLLEGQKDALLEMQYRAQQSHYASAFPDRERLVLLLDDQKIGALTLSRQPDSIAIVDIAIASEFQGKGIGSSVLRSLVAEGATICLHVEKASPAQRLYRRFGFVETADDGMSLAMIRRP